ncbi:MAG: DUF3048 domain-containing protein [Acidimicrobiaceae bacterium]|nr:DUF3048 domain-containing protein [Acidimicrobiaceae bacterium]
MAARPGASPVGAVRARRRARLAAVLAAAATLAAACSASPQDAEPTVASLGPVPAPTSSESTATTVEAGDGEGDNGTAGDTGSEDTAAGEDAAGSGTTAGTTGGSDAGPTGGSDAGSDGGSTSGSDGGSTAAVEAEPSGTAEPAAPEDAASQGAGSEQASADDGASGAGPAGEGPADRESAERAASGAAASGRGPSGDGVDLEPFVTGPIAPLTGSLTTDLSLAQRRALAVKVGNGDPKDRPQAGLAAADIVYEVLVEAGVTRFIAVLHSEIPGRVGPVRSVRSSDFDILRDMAAPYLASSGANSIVRREMRDAARDGALVDVGAASMGAPYRRDRSRPAPHNLYFYYENLGGDDPDSLPGGVPAAPPPALFEYGSANPPPLEGAAGVTVDYASPYGAEASHVWDRILGGWVRIQDGTLHTTETDFGVAEIAPANVAVLWTPYGRSEADRRSPQAFSYGAGQALVLTAGSVHEAVWERTEDRAGYRFTDAAGDPLTLSTGSTWLLLANTSSRWPVAEVTVLSGAESARLLAEARAAAEAEPDAARAS